MMCYVSTAKNSLCHLFMINKNSLGSMQLKSDDLRTWYLEMDQHLYSTHIILPQGAKVVELTQNIPEPSVATRGWPSSWCGVHLRRP